MLYRRLTRAAHAQILAGVAEVSTETAAKYLRDPSRVRPRLRERLDDAQRLAIMVRLVPAEADTLLPTTEELDGLLDDGGEL